MPLFATPMLMPKADCCIRNDGDHAGCCVQNDADVLKDAAHSINKNNEAHACLQKENSCTVVGDDCRDTPPDVGTIISDVEVAMDVSCSSVNTTDR